MLGKNVRKKNSLHYGVVPAKTNQSHVTPGRDHSYPAAVLVSRLL